MSNRGKILYTFVIVGLVLVAGILNSNQMVLINEDVHTPLSIVGVGDTFCQPESLEVYVYHAGTLVTSGALYDTVFDGLYYYQWTPTKTGSWWISHRFGLDSDFGAPIDEYTAVDPAVFGVATGPYVLNVWLKDTTDSTGIPDGLIHLKNLAGSVMGFQFTDNTGLASFTVSAGTYEVLFRKLGVYNFSENPDTVTVVSADIDTIYYGSMFDPSASPGVPGLCRVYGWYVTPGGAFPGTTKVWAEPVELPQHIGWYTLSMQKVIDTCDVGTGYYKLDLVCTVSDSGDTAKYHFFSTDGRIDFEAVVPDTGSVKLKKLLEE